MDSGLVKGVRDSVKTQWKRARLSYVRTLYAFDAEKFSNFLRSLGVADGDVVLAHSSYDRFAAFRGTPAEVIACLKRAVGDRGTLLMPTLPFRGTAVEYVLAQPLFDVVRTPSQMGLLTELFRRSVGSVRSVHPTHSVAAWGARAHTITADHHLASTPCGRGSPYARMLENDGKLLFLGTGTDVMTFFHTVEEILEPVMPFSPFTREFFSLQSRATDGTLLVTNTRLFEPKYSRRRNLTPLMASLKKHGCWRESVIGNLSAILLQAKDVLQQSELLATGGVFCYGP